MNLSGGYTALPSRNLTFLTRTRGTVNRNTLNRHSEDGGELLNRGRTLVRTERHVEPEPLISKTGGKVNVWRVFSWMVTCCCMGVCLKRCGVQRKQQQAWREKVALCAIAFLLSAIVGFFILGLGRVLCPDPGVLTVNPVRDKLNGAFVVRGLLYNATSKTGYDSLFRDAAFTLPGIDVSSVFYQPQLPSCTNLNYAFATLKYPCELDNSCLDLSKLETTYGFAKIATTKTPLGKVKSVDPVATFGWSDVNERKFKVYRTVILNLQPYFQTYPTPIKNDQVDSLLRSKVSDLTLTLRSNPELENRIMRCLIDKYTVGKLDAESGRCLFVNLLIYFTYIIILGVTLIRFIMALFFDWFLASSLARDPKPEILYDHYTDLKVPKPTLRTSLINVEEKLLHDLALQDVRAQSDSDLYTVLLVTCYSEGEDSIRTTLESLAKTEYNDRKKLLFIVADGLITGKGNKKSTPEIIVDMIILDPAFGGQPKAYSYLAVATGAGQHNMAKVYCGHFECEGRFIPTIVVVKCGTPDESVKPGNRGKRDSQIILMSFFNRVFLNDRMTPLDFDMFRKIHHLAGVTPDFFEIVVMVDADTRVAVNSLRKMVNCMQNDSKIMGLCGETLIANKHQSWITKIQVFEYYISHHLGKAFESVWGGVTCLPGCFCAYRLKSRKSGGWVPILVNPDIVEQYSTNKTNTLHEKNLLLLGEDRFLSTLMLRQFPRRKMVFTPDAKCHTVVPDEFKMLVSQRRRWINSTIHNLMELVLIKNLCGTFCFSMQFIVFLDVLGTAVLPISLLIFFWVVGFSVYSIIVTYAVDKQVYFDPMQIVPLCMLIGVLILPAVLVALTGKNVLSKLKWMGYYLLALPVWQVLLPLYAFWNFDDFSWGQTRQIDGDSSEEEELELEFDSSVIVFKKWEEYELSWRRNIIKSRELKQREEFRQSAQTLNDQINEHPSFVPGYDSRVERPFVDYGQQAYGTYVGGPQGYGGEYGMSPYMLTMSRMPAIPNVEMRRAYGVNFVEDDGSDVGSEVRR